MARTTGFAPRQFPRRRLVMSLPIRDPTSTVGAELREATDDGVAFERQATGEPVSKRTCSCRRAAAAAAAAALHRLPEEIVACEILVRLPARDILRCPAVCRHWLRLASAPDFLLAHHRRQPSLPLVVLYRAFYTSEAAGLPICGRGRPVVGFDDRNNDRNGFMLHASCDGLLLLSRSDGGFSICNPATRQCAPLPKLTSAGRINIVIAALYLHHPSREYRVLYWKKRHWKGSEHVKEASCYILTMRPGGSPRPRCIRVPSETPAIEKSMIASNEMTPTNVTPPVVLRNCLHWEPSWLCYDVGDIVVFDTVVESFRFMCCPPGDTRCCTRLCNMEGSIGFSCFDDGRTIARIWVLEDYEREVWAFKYHVKFPVESLCHFTDTRHFILSDKGDVLVYSMYARCMFHCDNTGKLLDEFQWKPESQGLSIIGHRLKESLVKHKFFARRETARDGQPSFFQRL